MKEIKIPKKMECKDCKKKTMKLKRVMEYQIFGVAECENCGIEKVVKLIVKGKK